VAKNLMRIDVKDNVAIALAAMEAGDTGVLLGTEEQIQVLDKVPTSHKVAVRDIAKGEEIIKYGEVIAVAELDIGKGCWVHNHNIQ